MSFVPYALFITTWAVIVYAFNSIVAKRLKRVEPKVFFLYASTLMLVGMFGEVFSDSLYNLVFDRPLWEYRVAPIHGGYTSYFSVVIWGLYGFYLYLFHSTLTDSNVKQTRYLATIVAFEAVFLEFILNLSHLLIFGGYIFYYLPSDLWHLTTIQAIPFYFIAGFVIVRLIRYTQAQPVFFTLFNLTLVTVLVLFTN